MGVPVVITDMSTSAASNSPAGSDSIGTSLDDYIRSHAAFIAQLFATSNIYSSVVGGTGSVITLTPSPAIIAYAAGQKFGFIAGAANGGATTVNINGLGAKNITKNGATALVANDILSGSLVQIEYDGTQFQLLSVNTAAFLPTASEATLASATTTDLGSAGSNVIKITGTTTITALGSSAVATNSIYFVRFTGILTLTYNATSLIVPTSANITTANGDFLIAEYLGSGNWKVLSYQKIDGTPLGITAIVNGGTGVSSSDPVIQRVSTLTGAVSTGTTTLPNDDTIPQNTEGDQYMSLAITPKNTANILIIDVVFFGSVSVASPIGVALFQDSTAGALAAGINFQVSTDAQNPKSVTFRHIMTAGTTSATTFKVRAGGTSGTMTFNGNNGSRVFGGVMSSSIMITEYAT